MSPSPPSRRRPAPAKPAPPLVRRTDRASAATAPAASPARPQRRSGCRPPPGAIATTATCVSNVIDRHSPRSRCRAERTTSSEIPLRLRADFLRHVVAVVIDIDAAEHEPVGSSKSAVCASSTSRSANSHCGSVGASPDCIGAIAESESAARSVARSTVSSYVMSPMWSSDHRRSSSSIGERSPVPPTRRPAPPRRLIEIPLRLVEAPLLEADVAEALHRTDVVAERAEHGFPFVERAHEIAPVDGNARHEIVRVDVLGMPLESAQRDLERHVELLPAGASASPSCRNTRLDGSRASSSLQRRISSAIDVSLHQTLQLRQRGESPVRAHRDAPGLPATAAETAPSSHAPTENRRVSPRRTRSRDGRAGRAARLAARAAIRRPPRRGVPRASAHAPPRAATRRRRDPLVGRPFDASNGENARRRQTVRDLRDLEFLAARARRQIARRSRTPSIIVSTCHSCGKQIEHRAAALPPPSTRDGASSGITPAFGMTSAMRDHSSMRRAPSMSSDSVDTVMRASRGKSLRARSSNEKNPSRHDISSNTTLSSWRRSWRSSSLLRDGARSRRADRRLGRESPAAFCRARALLEVGFGDATGLHSASSVGERFAADRRLRRRGRRRRRPGLHPRAFRTTRAACPSSGSDRAAERRRECRAREAVLRSPSASAPRGPRLDRMRCRSLAVRISRRARRAYSVVGPSSMTRSHRSIASRYRCCSTSIAPLVKQRADVRRIEAKHARERVHGVALCGRARAAFHPARCSASK